MITMRSTRQEIVEAIDEAARGYAPGEGVELILRRTILVPIIGPFAVGKTSCMRYIEDRYQPEFGRVRSFTTRSRRRGEEADTYHFRPHTKTTLREILESLEKKSLVQAAVHPSTGYVYGTYSSEYAYGYSMLDTLASAIDSISALPFGDIYPVGMVAPAADWLRRIGERKDNTSERIIEARSSLVWLLDQGPDLPWVVNADSRLRAAAEEVVGLVRREREPDPANRVIGELLLKSLDALEDTV
jgi:hypothetical protein